MNKVLLFGGGTKWGHSFTHCLSSKDIEVDLVTSNPVNLPNVNNIVVNWYNLDRDKIKLLLDTQREYDLIFFNHNSGGAPSDHFLKPNNEIELNQWNYSYWINCQLPYVVVHHCNIQPQTKIGWMLTGLISGSDCNLYQYAGYAGVKSTNLHIMRGFSVSHPGIFFALNPLWFPEQDYEKDSTQIYNLISNLTYKDNGKAINKDGSEWII